MIVHRRVVVAQARRHLGDVLVALGRHCLHPVRDLQREGVTVARLEQRRIANDRGDDLDVGVHFLRLDVDLNELLRLGTPGLALAVRQQPVEPRADQHHDIGLCQHGGACRARALRMRVGEEALAHAHGQERDAAFLHQRADRVIGLRVGCALAEDDERTLGGLENVECALDGVGRGDLRGRCVDHLHQRLLALLGVDHLAEQLGRQVEIDAARTA